MRIIALIVVIYILADIQRRLRDKDKFVTQKQFADFKTAQAAADAQIVKRIESLEASPFA